MTKTSSNITPPKDIDSLPDDAPTLKAALAELLAAYQAEQLLNANLQHQIEKLLRQRYGRKSETFDWKNGLFPDEVIDALLGITENGDGNDSEEEAEKETVTYERKTKRSKGHGRQVLPDHLERVRNVKDIPEEEKRCSVCDTKKIVIREEVSEQLEYVPASLFVNQNVRLVYACPQEHEVSIAEPDMSNPIPRGLAGPGLLAQVAVSKYGDHLPLYRQEDIFSRHGVHISRSTQCDWMRETAMLLMLLYECMKRTILSANVIHTDDTVAPLLAKGKTIKGRQWIYYDPGRRLAVFDFTTSRSRDGPMKFLEGYCGYLQADAYAGYDAVFVGDSVKEVACWAHARRKFDEAKSVQPTTAITALAWINRLYDVEREANNFVKKNAKGLDEQASRALLVKKRYELRQEKSTKIMKEFNTWLLKQEEHVLPKSPVGQALKYVRSNWDALNRYLENGELSIDNNEAEQAMRHIAVGRKNWLFHGSEQGGETAAVWVSLMYSAKLHKLDLFAYAKDVLERISTTPVSELEQFLPDVWKRTHGSAGEPQEDDSDANQDGVSIQEAAMVGG